MTIMTYLLIDYLQGNDWNDGVMECLNVQIHDCSSPKQKIQYVFVKLCNKLINEMEACQSGSMLFWLIPVTINVRIV